MGKIYNIKFTEYSQDKYVLHIDDKRHFLINNEQMDIIKNIISGDDEQLKKSLYTELCSMKQEEPSYIGLQDYQYKATIISSKIMNIISRPFIWLFNIYVFSLLLPIVSIIGAVIFFIVDYSFLDQNFYIKMSWLLIPLMAMFHEIGHASACKRYGVAVNEVGVGIAGFRPVMYANVNGAWYLPKNQRVIVNLGGIYFQLLYAIGLGFVSICINDSCMFYVCKIMYVSVIFQFYPFYKSDGYWIVSDILNEPNLYKNAQSIFIKKIKRDKGRLNKREIKLFVYYITFELLILISVITMATNFYRYIITLPFLIFREFTLMANGNFKDVFLVDIKYIWTLLFVFVIIKQIIRSMRKTFTQKGLGRCKQISPNHNQYEKN